MSESLLAAPRTVTVYRGESRTLRLRVRAPSGEVVLAGSSVRLTIKRTLKQREPVVSKTTDDPVQGQVVPVGNYALFYLLGSDTRYLDPETYTYDVWLTLANGQRHVVIPPSDFVVLRGVTQFG